MVDHRRKYPEKKEFVSKARESQIIVIGGEEHHLDEFYRSRKLMKQLVDENPELAHHHYCITENENLGTIFAQTYNCHSEWGSEAFHIGQRFDISGIQEPHSDLKDEIEEFESKLDDSKNHNIYDPRGLRYKGLRYKGFRR